jgi:hypothetical protein
MKSNNSKFIDGKSKEKSKTSDNPSKHLITEGQMADLTEVLLQYI